MLLCVTVRHEGKIKARFTQQTTDLLFSFSGLGFQEFETSKYIVRTLRENGFTVQEGVYGFATAWTASASRIQHCDLDLAADAR